MLSRLLVAILLLALADSGQIALAQTSANRAQSEPQRTSQVHANRGFASRPGSSGRLVDSQSQGNRGQRSRGNVFKLLYTDQDVQQSKFASQEQRSLGVSPKSTRVARPVKDGQMYPAANRMRRIPRRITKPGEIRVQFGDQIGDRLEKNSLRGGSVQQTGYVEPSRQDLHNPFGGSDTLKHPFGEIPAKRKIYRYRNDGTSPFPPLPGNTSEEKQETPEEVSPIVNSSVETTDAYPEPSTELPRVPEASSGFGNPQQSNPLQSVERTTQLNTETIPIGAQRQIDSSDNEIPKLPSESNSESWQLPSTLGSSDVANVETDDRELTSSNLQSANPSFERVPEFNTDIKSAPQSFSESVQQPAPPNVSSRPRQVPPMSPLTADSLKKLKNATRQIRGRLRTQNQLTRPPQPESKETGVIERSYQNQEAQPAPNFPEPFEQETNQDSNQSQKNRNDDRSESVVVPPADPPGRSQESKPDPFLDPPDAKPVYEYDFEPKQDRADLRVGGFNEPENQSRRNNRQGVVVPSQPRSNQNSAPLPFEYYGNQPPAADLYHGGAHSAYPPSSYPQPAYPQAPYPQPPYPNPALQAYQPFMAPRNILETYDGILARDGSQGTGCESCDSFQQSQSADGMFYLSIFSGPASPSNFSSFDRFGNQLGFDLDTGYGLGFALGHVQGRNLRTELELAFRDQAVDSMFFNQPGSATQQVNVGGDLTTYSGMANVYWEFVRFRRCRVKPYVGAGIGFAAFDASIPLSPVTSFDESSLAYQFMAGLNFKLGQNTDLFTEYRYFNADGVSIDSNLATLGGPSSSNAKFDFSSQDVFFGLRFKF